MNDRYKTYIKMNLVSLVFIVISFISITLAWFAYSGMSKVSTDVNVKAWYIEFNKNGQKVSNDIVISLSEIYPGMNPITEEVNIKNMGDSDAEINYSIVSARILGDEKDNYEIDEDIMKSLQVENTLSHDYPFHVNINLNKKYISSKSEDGVFKVSVSWPLDSDNNEIDSLWGTEAYKFQKDEEEKHNNDSNYQVRPSIQIVISVTAQQYMEENNSPDSKYDLGSIVLFDPVNNKGCSKLGEGCIKTYVIDSDNKISDSFVSLLPDPKSTHVNGTYYDYDTLYSSRVSTWTVPTRKLKIEDMLKVISNDIINSYLIRENISDLIIGFTKDSESLSELLTKVINYNGNFKFLNNSFDYLVTSNCYWTSTEFNIEKAFSYKVITEDNSILHGENKNTECNVIPVIEALKEIL